ncbi:hypothetical protein L2725_09735 [Shewanella corallii]|uniref:Lipoprotein n=2 Tax=Shewanella TaxID=22 RepID=A0ABT0N6I6_9GAMM|nr:MULTISPECIES: hypothetical protein [Shewanella]MCL1038224.1 hypothetical protein [Shewanella submarina]MCL2914067.1 hypothetical protein [Shewanella corallii]
MKKVIGALIMVTALSACEDANKAIDKAQSAANTAVDSIQEQMESIDLSKLDLEQFGDAAKSAEALVKSVEEALELDFSNPKALNEVTEHIASAYNCMVDATSESSAEALMNKMMDRIQSEETKSLIERSIEKGKALGECVM